MAKENLSFDFWLKNLMKQDIMFKKKENNDLTNEKYKKGV